MPFFEQQASENLQLHAIADKIAYRESFIQQALAGLIRGQFFLKPRLFSHFGLSTAEAPA